MNRTTSRGKNFGQLGGQTSVGEDTSGQRPTKVWQHETLALLAAERWRRPAWRGVGRAGTVWGLIAGPRVTIWRYLGLELAGRPPRKRQRGPSARPLWASGRKTVRS